MVAHLNYTDTVFYNNNAKQNHCNPVDVSSLSYLNVTATLC